MLSSHTNILKNEELSHIFLSILSLPFFILEGPDFTSEGQTFIFGRTFPIFKGTNHPFLTTLLYLASLYIAGRKTILHPHTRIYRLSTEIVATNTVPPAFCNHRFSNRRGNTKLKNGHSFQSELTSGFSALNHLNFYIFTTYNYNNNAVRESAIAENDHIVRLPMNFDRHIWKYGAEISLFNINHVYGSFAIGQNRFWSKLKTTGDKFHYVDSYMRLNGTVEIGAWDVSVSWWDHNNDFDGETVFSSGRGLYFTVERAWLDGNLSTSLTLSNPFKTNYGREYTKNHSKAAPYTYKMRYPYSHNLLDLTVVFKFAFGKRVSDEKIATGINASSGALNTDSKDNK